MYVSLFNIVFGLYFFIKHLSINFLFLLISANTSLSETLKVKKDAMKQAFQFVGAYLYFS